MQRTITSEHFVELMAAETLNPRGEWRADLRSAIVAATVVNANPFRAKGARAAEPKDFMPSFEPRRKASARELSEKLRAWAASFGG